MMILICVTRVSVTLTECITYLLCELPSHIREGSTKLPEKGDRTTLGNLDGTQKIVDFTIRASSFELRAASSLLHRPWAPLKACAGAILGGIGAKNVLRRSLSVLVWMHTIAEQKTSDTQTTSQSTHRALQLAVVGPNQG